MKTRLTPLLAGLACVLLLPSVASAGGHKIGVLLKGQAKFWDVVGRSATAAGEKAGCEVVVRAAPLETDIATQVQLLNALAAQGAQAIVMAPAHREALAEPAAALAARGIKIVVIDSPLAGTAGSTFIGTDHRAAGEAAGRLLAELISDGDEVTFLKHAQNNIATADRENGALKSLRAVHGALTVRGDIYASTEKGVEAERARLVFSRYPGTKAVLASGTAGTMAMCSLLASREPGQVKLVGFGFNLNPEVAAALEAGTMHGWIAQLPGDVGRIGVETALALLEGKEVPPVIHTDFVVITRQNLREPKVQALLAL